MNKTRGSSSETNPESDSTAYLANSPNYNGAKSNDRFIQHRSKEEIWCNWFQGVGTLIISGVVAWMTLENNKNADNTAKREIYIAQQNRTEDARRSQDEQQHEIMSSYLEEMTKLLVEQNLKESSSGTEVRTLARSITLNAARRLNPERKGQLLKFLYEAGLINTCFTNPVPTFSSESCDADSILDLDSVSLVKTQFNPKDPPVLTGIDLTGTDLSNAFLKELGLVQAVMPGATLEHAKLSGSFLNGAEMEGAKMEGADLARASLFQAQLDGADLRNVNFQGAILKEADLRCAWLQGADLGPNLQESPSNSDPVKTFDERFQGAQFDGATYDAETTFPPDFNPDEYKMKKIVEQEPDKLTGKSCVNGEWITDI